MGDLIRDDELQILSSEFITDKEPIFDLYCTNHVIVKHLLLMLLLLWGTMLQRHLLLLLKRVDII
jgi:hypothetical protein